LTKILLKAASNKLVLKSMDCPSDMSWKSAVIFSIGRLCLPNKLSFIL